MDNTVIDKTYSNRFKLNKSKAVRINNVIESNLKKMINTTEVVTLFKIRLNNEKEVTINDFNNIFQLDNGKKNRIERIALNWHIGESEVDLMFNDTPNINLSVKGEDINWVNQTFAEIDEQIERTKIDSTIEKIKGFFTILTFLTIVVSISFGIFSLMEAFPSGEKAISKSEKIELTKMAKEADNISEKIEFLFQAELYQLNIDLGEKKGNNLLEQFKEYGLNWKTYAILLPILIIISIIYYILSRCYPSSIFEWGDMEEYYEKIIERRKMLWNIVIGTIILGIICNLFVYSITTFSM